MEEEYEDWIIEGVGSAYVEFVADTLRFEPSDCHNLLGHVAEWTAKLEDWQVEELQAIADEDGDGLKIEWGVFMCPAHVRGKLLVVDTGGVW